MCAVCGWCLRACMCVAHVSTVVGVSRGVENHVLDEAIFCVQVRAAATALAREIEDHILLLALDVAGGFLKFSEVPKRHCLGILLHTTIYIYI
jgi:hypothetical protein